MLWFYYEHREYATLFRNVVEQRLKTMKLTGSRGGGGSSEETRRHDGPIGDVETLLQRRVQVRNLKDVASERFKQPNSRAIREGKKR